MSTPKQVGGPAAPTAAEVKAAEERAAQRIRDKEVDDFLAQQTEQEKAQKRVELLDILGVVPAGAPAPVAGAAPAPVTAAPATATTAPAPVVTATVKKNKTGLIVAAVVGGVVLILLIVALVAFLSGGKSSQPVAQTTYTAPRAPAPAVINPQGLVKTDAPVVTTPQAPAPQVQAPAPTAAAQIYDKVEITLTSPSKDVKRVFVWYADGQKVVDDQPGSTPTTNFRIQTGRVVYVNAEVHNHGDASVIGWATDPDPTFGTTNTLNLLVAGPNPRDIDLVGSADNVVWQGHLMYKVLIDQYGVPQHVK